MVGLWQGTKHTHTPHHWCTTPKHIEMEAVNRFISTPCHTTIGLLTPQQWKTYVHITFYCLKQITDFGILD